MAWLPGIIVAVVVSILCNSHCYVLTFASPVEAEGYEENASVNGVVFIVIVPAVAVIPVLQTQVVTEVKVQTAVVQTTTKAQTLVKAVVVPVLILLINVSEVISKPRTKERL